jgi:hypothetical protein
MTFMKLNSSPSDKAFVLAWEESDPKTTESLFGVTSIQYLNWIVSGKFIPAIDLLHK